jgi:hypothetical protein
MAENAILVCTLHFGNVWEERMYPADNSVGC